MQKSKPRIRFHTFVYIMEVLVIIWILFILLGVSTVVILKVSHTDTTNGVEEIDSFDSCKVHSHLDKEYKFCSYCGKEIDKTDE